MPQIDSTSIMNYVMIGTWAIFGFFILINFLIGLKRGTKKSLFYTVTSLVLSFVVLFLISLVSVRMIFPTPGALLSFLEKIGFSDSNSIVKMLEDPAVNAMTFGVVDIVFKIILFFILYPIVKFLLTVLIARPIYKRAFDNNNGFGNITKDKKMLKQIQGNTNNITMGSRFGGAILGAVRGFVVAFLLFVPFIVIVGVSSGITYDFTTNNNLDASNEYNESVSEYVDIIKSLQTFNDSSIFGLSKKLKVGEKSIDELIFDFSFNGTVKYKDEKDQKLKIATDPRKIGEAVNELLKMGVLEKDFDFKSISHEKDFKYIQSVLDKLGDINAINVALPLLLEFGANNIEQVKDLDLINNPYTKNSFNALRKIKWKNEMGEITDIVEEALKLGSVGELEELFKNLGILENEDLEQIGNIVYEFGDLEILTAFNILVEYAINNKILPVVKNDLNYDDYYHEKLAFVLNNPSFLSSEEGQITYLGTLIKELFSNEEHNFDIAKLFNDNKLDLKYLLEDEVSPLVSALIKGIGNFELLIGATPIAFDYLLYDFADKEDFDAIDELSKKIFEIDYGNELSNINGIYEEIIKIGLNNYLGESNNTITLIDLILSDEENFASAKTIINSLFVDSDIVTSALDLSSEFLITKFVKNEGMKEFGLDLVSNEEFKIGKEVASIVDIVGHIYQVSNIDTIMKDFNSKNYFGLSNVLGSFSQDQYNDFKTSLMSLQTLHYTDASLVTNLIKQNESSKIVVPEAMTALDFAKDLITALDLAYSVSFDLKAAGATNENYKSIELSEVINSDNFTQALNFDHVEKPNSILLHSAVKFFKTLKFEVSGIGTLGNPIELENKESNTKEWTDELNGLVSSVIKTISSKAKDDDLVITIDTLLNFSKINTVDMVGLFNRFLNTLNEVNVVNGEDDLDRFVKTLTIHNFINDAVNGELFETTLVKALEGAIGKPVDNFTTKPDVEEQDINNKLKVSEVKSLLLGTQAINLVNDGKIKIEIAELFALGQDDAKFDQFFKSNYLTKLISNILVLDGIKEIISTSAGFDYNDLTLSRALDSNGYLSRTEIKAMLNALNTLGINDFANINIDIAAIIALLDDGFDTILESNYFYQVIDLIIKKQITDLTVVIPTGAFESDGYITKLEITKVLESLKVLGIIDSGSLDGDSLTTNNLIDINNIDSLIIRAVLSKELVKAVTFPTESYEANEDNLILKSEIDALIEAITIVEPDLEKPIKDIDLNNLTITVDQLTQLIEIQKDTGGSPVINRIISKAIINSETNSGLVIPNDAYELNSIDDIKREEIEKLPEIFTTLGLVNLKDPINTDTLSMDTLINLLIVDSVIINNTISNQLISSSFNILEIPDEAYTNSSKERVSNIEMLSLFKGLKHLNVTIQTINQFDALTVELEKLALMISEDSLIVQRAISKELININNIIVDQTLLINDDKDIIQIELERLINNGVVTGFINLADIISTIDNAMSNIPRLTAALAAIIAMPEEERSVILVDSITNIMP